VQTFRPEDIEVVETEPAEIPNLDKYKEEQIDKLRTQKDQELKEYKKK